MCAGGLTIAMICLFVMFISRLIFLLNSLHLEQLVSVKALNVNLKQSVAVHQILNQCIHLTFHQQLHLPLCDREREAHFH